MCGASLARLAGGVPPGPPTPPCVSRAGVSAACRVPVARRATQRTPRGEGPSCGDDPAERYGDEVLGAVLPRVACVQQGRGEEEREEDEAEAEAPARVATTMRPCGGNPDADAGEQKDGDEERDCRVGHGPPSLARCLSLPLSATIPHNAMAGETESSAIARIAPLHRERTAVLDCPYIT